MFFFFKLFRRKKYGMPFKKNNKNLKSMRIKKNK